MKKIGIIGAGRMGRAHARALRSVRGAWVTSVMDTDAAACRSLARACSAEACGDMDQLLAEEPEVIDICTPTDTHAELALAALAAGRHVIVEAPMARNPADARRMAEAAKKAGRKLMVCCPSRYDHACVTLRTAVAAGTAGKPRLRVIDSIGNHKCFLDKPRALLMALCGIDETRGSLRAALRALEDGVLELPPGCSVKYELEAIDVLAELLSPKRAEDVLRDAYTEFRDRHGRRPSAAELSDSGVLAHEQVRRVAGSWFAFVRSMGDLDGIQVTVETEHRDWFEEWEATPMLRRFQMQVLLALLELDAIPGSASLAAVEQRFARIADRSAAARAELGLAMATGRTLRQVLVDAPVKAIIGRKHGKGSRFFEPTMDPLRTKFTVRPEHRAVFVEMTRELVEWRLADFVDRKE